MNITLTGLIIHHRQKHLSTLVIHFFIVFIYVYTMMGSYYTASVSPVSPRYLIIFVRYNVMYSYLVDTFWLMMMTDMPDSHYITLYYTTSTGRSVTLINAVEGRKRKTIHSKKYGCGVVRYTHHDQV